MQTRKGTTSRRWDFVCLGRQAPEIATQSQTEALWWSPKTAASEMANKKEVIILKTTPGKIQLSFSLKRYQQPEYEQLLKTGTKVISAAKAPSSF